MTDLERIGQRLVTGFPGTALTPELVQVVKEYKIGNIILFREMYGDAYVEQLLKKANELDVPLGDVLATATRFTAECISAGVRDYCPVKPDRMIVGGGGSMNPTLLAHIADCLPGCEVMTNEQLGLDSNAKEAVAFAVLANEAMYGQPNNAPGATGAAHPVVMGKISQ